MIQKQKKIGDVFKMIKEKIEPLSTVYLGKKMVKKQVVPYFQNPDCFVIQENGWKFLVDIMDDDQLVCSCKNSKIKCFMSWPLNECYIMKL